ncbi:MAG: DNA-protecting protein DprA [Rhodospirillales bacterium]|nr:DNA-protecting protein DprA [Rhodospirillales bacterium]MCB9964698.1 DNA-protecting protein DprA [Rhodospirillales bacterium]
MTLDLFRHHPPARLPLSTSEKVAWVRLIRSENIGPVTFYRLLERFGSAVRALENLPTLSQRGGRSKAMRPIEPSVIEKEMNDVHNYGATLLYACEPDYPLALAVLEDAPPVLSVKGRVDLLNCESVAMVGARNASLNGRKFAEMLARDLGQGGQVVISGLARGIDTAAHQGALATGTVAVIAGGIDVVYPEENKGLYERLATEGVLVAESPFAQVPFAQSFPKRNRIISGLAAGVVVVEASLRSGSLITARLAAEQGRDVFAVPGFPLDPRAQGPNKLLQDGAVLVQSADDILQVLNGFTRSSPRSFQESAPSTAYEADSIYYEEDESVLADAQSLILSRLSNVPIQQDQLLRETGLDTAAFNSVLLELEIAGRLQRHAGGRVSLGV